MQHLLEVEVELVEELLQWAEAPLDQAPLDQAPLDQAKAKQGHNNRLLEIPTIVDQLSLWGEVQDSDILHLEDMEVWDMVVDLDFLHSVTTQLSLSD